MKKKPSRQTVASRFLKEANGNIPLSSGSVENLTSQNDDSSSRANNSSLKHTPRVSAHSIGEIIDTIKFSTSEPNLTKNHHSFSEAVSNDSSPLRQSISLSDSNKYQ